MDTEGDRKQNSQEEKNTKRRMKTPSQLEMLEKVFAEEKYPSEAVRAELSAQLALSDRQLQMWFCHRRLKDRKVKEEENPSPAVVKKPKKEKSSSSKDGLPPVIVSEMMDSARMAGVENYCNDHLATEVNGCAQGDVISRTTKPSRKRGNKDVDYFPRKKGLQVSFRGVDPRRAAELRAIASVESQLGEPLREEGPILGVDFDPLPPGAFDTPIVPLLPVKPTAARDSSHFENKATERREVKVRKNVVQENRPSGGRQRKSSTNVPGGGAQLGSRSLQEYQFIPEQPSARSEDSQAYERSNHSKFYLGLEYPFQTFPSPASFLHGSDTLALAFGLQGRLPHVGASILPQVDGRRSHLFPRGGIDFDGLRHESFVTSGYDGRVAGHETSTQALPARTSCTNSDKLTLLHEQEQARMEKKRKSEEARIAKEVEAHEKRIRREIERQEAARRKREEQMRKELERLDREKRREEERALREKQREEERIQREQRREFERQEKLLQKETKKIERQRCKEEIRRQKESAKMKAALERATARRLARESMELIDDERLELLEAAAASQGLPSIYLLDGETLQGLDKYRGTLMKFPPASVKMKKPLAVQPWIGSDQNVGNLLMIWKFVTTFADILGLWPFTIDEFVQAFHDYDPRLLAEIHIALLKTLVKDIEDVVQASANGMVVNQYTVSFTGGGHPQLVEAAYAWGFDIREWHWHLSPLTWPEVLRQFALAAGYGPKWKKRKSDSEHLQDDDEGHEYEAAVNTLRTGAAAANAAALMRGKGGGHPRRCRHRLTPGTVKYAAFHVLSIEGSKGLTILDVADRIQKSGLRDLSTSKTPEASIAAALSRDTKLFERVAPSTYCVRAPYRKDSEDAEAILQLAREKIHLFQSGLTDVEEAEKETEDVDEAEREEDYDEDAEDVLADDVDGTLNDGKVIFCLREGKVVQVSEKMKMQQAQESNVRNIHTHDLTSMYHNKPSIISEEGDVTKSVEDGRERRINLEDCLKGTVVSEETEIDESHVGEPWVQGLMEGEYSDLSVEERLNAMVALVEMVNEGNTIRVALEERLEAANALKRQMWAEAQLDKRRFKEEQLLKSLPELGEGARPEGSNPSAEGQESPLGEHENSIDVTKPKTEWHIEQAAPATPGNVPAVIERTSAMQTISNQENSLAPQVGPATDKSRTQLKADIGLRAEELYVYRSLPLGSDRRHNRYWQFVTCNAGLDPGGGRIYFESSEDGHWEVIDTEESLNSLMASLDTRGVREAHLHIALQKIENFLKQGMKKFWLNEHGRTNSIVAQIEKNDIKSGYALLEVSSGGESVLTAGDVLVHTGAIPIEFGHNQNEQQHALERYHDFDRWLWSQCIKGSYNLHALKFGKKRNDLLAICEVCHEFYWPRERHCSCCHTTFEVSPKAEAKFTQHQLECDERQRNDSNWRLQSASKFLPSRIQLLKAQILAIEVAIPAESLKVTWSESRRKTWASMLKRAVSSIELFQALTELESSIHRDWLSTSYETTEELLRVAVSESKVAMDTAGMGGAAVLPWVPHTTAAVALRLMVFDSALSYSLEQKHKRSIEVEDNGPTRNVANGDEVLPLGNSQDSLMEDHQLSTEEDGKVDTWSDARQPSRGRGRGGRPRGRGRGRSGSTGNAIATTHVEIAKVLKRKLKFSEEAPAGDSHQTEKSGRGRARGGRGRGRGTTTAKGRGRGSRNGRRRQSDLHKCRDSGGYSFAGQQMKRGMHLQVSKQDDQSDENNSQSFEDWEVQEYGEGDNFNEQQDNEEDEEQRDNDEDEQQDNDGDQQDSDEDELQENDDDGEEDEDVDSLEEDEEAEQEEEQIVEDEFEDDGQYEEDGYTRAQVHGEDEDEAEAEDGLSSASSSSSSSLSSPSSSSSLSSSSEGGATVEAGEEDDTSQSMSSEESD